jgi:hypothetical protein
MVLILGRGLCSRPMTTHGAAMEVNTVPCRYVRNEEEGCEDVHFYTHIPALQFPVDEHGLTVLVQDVCLYSKEALFNPVDFWFRAPPPGKQQAPVGEFRVQKDHLLFPQLGTSGPVKLRQGLPLQPGRRARSGQLDLVDVDLDGVVETSISANNHFCLKWRQVRSSNLTVKRLFMYNQTNLIYIRTI